MTLETTPLLGHTRVAIPSPKPMDPYRELPLEIRSYIASFLVHPDASTSSIFAKKVLCYDRDHPNYGTSLQAHLIKEANREVIASTIPSINVLFPIPYPEEPWNCYDQFAAALLKEFAKRPTDGLKALQALVLKNGEIKRVLRIVHHILDQREAPTANQSISLAISLSAGNLHCLAAQFLNPTQPRIYKSGQLLNLHYQALQSYAKKNSEDLDRLSKVFASLNEEGLTLIETLATIPNSDRRPIFELIDETLQKMIDTLDPNIQTQLLHKFPSIRERLLQRSQTARWGSRQLFVSETNSLLLSSGILLAIVGAFLAHFRPQSTSGEIIMLSGLSLPVVCIIGTISYCKVMQCLHPYPEKVLFEEW